MPGLIIPMCTNLSMVFLSLFCANILLCILRTFFLIYLCALLKTQNGIPMPVSLPKIRSNSIYVVLPLLCANISALRSPGFFLKYLCARLKIRHSISMVLFCSFFLKCVWAGLWCFQISSAQIYHSVSSGHSFSNSSAVFSKSEHAWLMGLFCSFGSNLDMLIIWLFASLLHKYTIFPLMDFFLKCLRTRLKIQEDVSMVLFLSFCSKQIILPSMFSGLCWIYKYYKWQPMSVCLYSVESKNIALDFGCRIWSASLKTTCQLFMAVLFSQLQKYMLSLFWPPFSK